MLWTQPWLEKKLDYGAYHTLVQELHMSDKSIQKLSADGFGFISTTSTQDNANDPETRRK